MRSIGNILAIGAGLSLAIIAGCTSVRSTPAHIQIKEVTPFLSVAFIEPDRYIMIRSRYLMNEQGSWGWMKDHATETRFAQPRSGEQVTIQFIYPIDLIHSDIAIVDRVIEQVTQHVRDLNAPVMGELPTNHHEIRASIDGIRLDSPHVRFAANPSPIDTIDRTIDVLVERLGEDVLFVRDPGGTIVQRSPFEPVPGPTPSFLNSGSPQPANHPAYIGELSHSSNAKGFLRGAVFVEGWDLVHVYPYSPRRPSQELLREQFEETLQRIVERQQIEDAPLPLLPTDPEPE